jgi:hypothetical protein
MPASDLQTLTVMRLAIEGRTDIEFRAASPSVTEYEASVTQRRPHMECLPSRPLIVSLILKK